MYLVYEGDKVIAICTRKEDAEVYVSPSSLRIDKTERIIVKK